MSARAFSKPIDPQEIQTHVPAVYSLCRRLLQDEHLAEDATQETFITALKRWDEGRSETRRGWLMQIAASRAIDLMRRRQHWQPAVSVDIPDRSSTSPEVLAVNAENRERLDQGLAQLPADTRRLVLLHCVSEMPYTQIESECGVSRKVAARVVEDGLGQLRRFMEAAPGAKPFAPAQLMLLPLLATPAHVTNGVLALAGASGAAVSAGAAAPAASSAAAGSATRTGSRLRLAGLTTAAAALALGLFWLNRTPAAAPVPVPVPAQAQSAGLGTPVVATTTAAVTPRPMPTGPVGETPVLAVTAPAAVVATAAEREAAFEARLSPAAAAQRKALLKQFGASVVDPQHPDKISAGVAAALTAAGIDPATLKPADIAIRRLPSSIGWIRYVNVKDMTFLELLPAGEDGSGSGPIPMRLRGLGQTVDACFDTFSPAAFSFYMDTTRQQHNDIPAGTVRMRMSDRVSGDLVISDFNLAWTTPQPYDLDAILTANHLTIPLDQRDVVAPMTPGSLVTLSTNARRLDAQLVQSIIDHQDEFGKPGSRAIFADGADGDLMYASFNLLGALETVGPKQSDVMRFTQFHSNTAQTGMLDAAMQEQMPGAATTDPDVAANIRSFALDVKDDLIENVVAKLNAAKDAPYKIELDPALVGRQLNNHYSALNDFTQLVKQIANDLGARRVKNKDGSCKLVVPTTPGQPDEF